MEQRLSQHSKSRCRFAPMLVVLLLATVRSAAHSDEIDFARDIRPLLADKCYGCHGPDAAARESDLRLDVRDIALDADAGWIVASDPKNSELLRRITSNDVDERMPPPDSKLHLTIDQVNLLRDWVSEGAVWPEDQHWSFKPPRRDLPTSSPIGVGRFDNRLVCARTTPAGGLAAIRRSQPSHTHPANLV